MNFWFFPLPSICGWFPSFTRNTEQVVQLGPRNINILAGESVIRKEYPTPRDEAKMVTACMHEALFEGLAYEMFPCASVSYCYLRAQTEKVMAPHSSTLAWKIPWTEEPGRLRSMGSLRVRHY